VALFTGVAVAIVTIYLGHKPEMLDPQCLADMAALGRLKLINVAEVHQGQLLALTI
jgi:phosphoribosylformylglycinamidine (FGAM) synthase PurS component